MEDKHVIVVGAGIAGLSCAYALSRSGIRVMVIESSPRVGGRMSTDVRDGFVIDRGAQFLSSAYPIVMAFVKDLGLEKYLRPTSPNAAIVRAGSMRRVRFDRPLSLLSSGLLKCNEWLSLAVRGMDLLKRTSSYPVNDYAAWEEFDTGDAQEWCQEFYGKGIAEYIFEPLMQGFYFQSLEGMSKALPIAVSRFNVQSPKTMTLDGGLGRLPDALASRLDVRLNTAVMDIYASNSGVDVRTEEGTFHANYVVLATTASSARRLFGWADSLERSLMATGYSSTVNLSIATDMSWGDRHGLKNVYGLLIPHAERDTIAAVGIESMKGIDRIPGGGELLQVMLCGKAGQDMLAWNEDSLLARITPELERYFPGISSSIRFVHPNRWHEAEPKSPIGRSRNISSYRRSMPAARRVVLAGDYMSMPFVEGAAESGLWAASQIRELIRSKTPQPVTM